MISHGLGRTLIVANPAARSGRGEGAAVFATRLFSSFHSATTSCEVRLTEGTGDAQQMAASADEYDIVIALGGDGVIHEVVNGLMHLPEDHRPRLAVIPMGSGNDFARTLAMTKNDPERSIAELMRGEERTIDVGKVNDTFFMQTLSFGVDAAIAIDTSKRRANKTRQVGSMLFATSGLKLIVTGMRGWPYKAMIDGHEVEGVDIAFAVQNGPTYGGGFRICPDALPNDGLLDLCYTQRRSSIPRALILFGLIRLGRHTRSKRLILQKVKHVELEFMGDDKPSCQVDGEPLEADTYTIDIVPSSLRVVVAKGCTW